MSRVQARMDVPTKAPSPLSTPRIRTDDLRLSDNAWQLKHREFRIRAASLALFELIQIT